MNNKKIISSLLIYFFIVTLLPVGFLVESVQAAEGYETYNEEKTSIQNKYDIDGEILQVKQYDDYSLALTGDALYFIENGKAKKYDLGKMDIFPSTKINRNGKYIYLTPYRRNSAYKLLSIDTEKFEAKSNLINQYIDFEPYSCRLQEVAIDSNNNKWFSVYRRDKLKYELLRVDNTQNSSANTVAEFDWDRKFHYDDAFTNLKVDSNNNAWFKITQNDYKAKKYMLGRVSQGGTVQKFNFEDYIKGYEIANDGTLWAAAGDKVIHFDKSGKIIKEFKVPKVKDISIDKTGNVWALDNNSVKQLINDQFKEEYKASKNSKEINVESKSKIAIRDVKGLKLINGNNEEEVMVSSYVNNYAFVLKDKSNDIRILSDNYKYSEEDKLKDDILVETTLKNGEFKINNTVATNYRTYEGAVLYKNEVYLPSYNSVYKITNNSLEEYIKLIKDNSSDTFKEVRAMEFDNNELLYVLGTDKIYIVDKNKNVEEISLSEINDGKKAYRYNLLKDNQGKIYLVTKTLDKKVCLYELKGKDYKKINYRLSSGKEPSDIFLSENDELEFVYNAAENGYMVYKLDGNNMMAKDMRFANQGASLMETYSEINGLEKTGDGKLVLWVDSNMIYTKDKGADNFVCNYDIKTDDYITSMETGSDGRVYIGTYCEGIICYGKSNSISDSIPSEVVPKEHEEKNAENSEDVSTNKEWTVKFNMKLDKDSVNESNILVVDKDGAKQKVKVYLGSDNTSIKLAPQVNYKDGEAYYIVIKETVKSSSGSNLSKPVIVKFNTKKAEKEETEETGDNLDVKFEIIESKDLDTREKSFTDYIITVWKDSVEDNNTKVSKAVIKNVSLGSSTAYVLFDSEILTKKDKETVKEVKTIKLNVKKQDGVWKIVE
ncbi:Ig-like domain-containing protein [Clostridium ganghwense]|uniref:Ig-like domain-containing protein n=1 Tax=Clostridium ganghwense TaxID=312089 RepID=A0ABT4CPA8_9CLOT|nr:Ig-like domain-containing protein [Clostridium ganghwense]MCY6370894.1 Ig-like domain-containing protein [Clostridium ganghwense]